MTKLAAIALNTFRESARDRVFYNLVLFALLLVIASLVMGRMAVGQEAKIVVDVGLSAMTLFGLLIAIFLGVGLVAKEIEKRTIVNLLSKPIGRGTFLIGKYAGLSLTLLADAAVMTLAIAAALAWAEGGFAARQLHIWPAAWLIFLQLAIVTAIALFFSTFSSPALSALFALLLFLIGRWSPDLKLFAETAASPIARGVCRALYSLLPNLAHFNRIDEVAHGGAIPAATLAWSTLYAAGYLAALLGGAAVVFERRNFK